MKRHEWIAWAFNRGEAPLSISSPTIFGRRGGHGGGVDGIPIFDMEWPVPYNGLDLIPEDAVLAEQDQPAEVAAEQALEIQRVNERLDMLDQRLDNIDSMVTVVAERVMNQLITLTITCPHCGKDIEISVVGNQRAQR